MVVVEIFAEEFGVGAFADSGGAKEEEEFLFAGGEVVENAGGQSEHDDISIKSLYAMDQLYGSGMYIRESWWGIIGE